MTLLFRLRALGVFSAGAAWLLLVSTASGATNVYSTQFEAAEGYDYRYELIGQLGWDGAGTGGNGLTNGILPGQGQHALIGYWPPLSETEDSFFVWQPINFDPVAAGLPLVTFSVRMSIEDSSNENFDYFRWSIYNLQNVRLFSIEFDNYPLVVNYQLGGNSPIVTNAASFVPGSNYVLTVSMNFASNRWSALLDNHVIATNQPINVTNASLTLGDIDAVWLIYNASAPGNNCMVFDNYQITASAIGVPPPPSAQMQFLSRTAEGWALLRVLGQHGSRWSVDATTNFTHWTPLKTNPISGNSFDYVDMTASGIQRRYYRARFVP